MESVRPSLPGQKQSRTQKGPGSGLWRPGLALPAVQLWERGIQAQNSGTGQTMEGDMQGHQGSLLGTQAPLHSSRDSLPGTPPPNTWACRAGEEDARPGGGHSSSSVHVRRGQSNLQNMVYTWTQCAILCGTGLLTYRDKAHSPRVGPNAVLVKIGNMERT